MNRTPAQEREAKKRKLAAQEMAQRILNYQAAQAKPDIRIGEHRKPSGAVKPKSQPIAVKRMEQLSHEDRWSSTKFSDNGPVQITVRDPRDPEGVVLPPITSSSDRPNQQISVADPPGPDSVRRKPKVFELRVPETDY
jgi:hypothetical protein